jgi:hypothetical protein
MASKILPPISKPLKTMTATNLSGYPVMNEVIKVFD